MKTKKRKRKIWRWLERHPDRWCKGALARDNNWLMVDVKSRKAVAWCALGLIAKFRSHDRLAEERLIAVTGHFNIEQWNDSRRSVKPIIAAFKKAGL